MEFLQHCNTWTNTSTKHILWRSPLPILRFPKEALWPILSGESKKQKVKADHFFENAEIGDSLLTLSMAMAAASNAESIDFLISFLRTAAITAEKGVN